MSWVIPEDVAPQLFAELIALRNGFEKATLPKGMLALLNELQKDYTSFPAQVSNSDPAAFPFDALEALNEAMRTTLSSPVDSSNSGMASSQSSTLVSASSATATVTSETSGSEALNEAMRTPSQANEYRGTLTPPPSSQQLPTNPRLAPTSPSRSQLKVFCAYGFPLPKRGETPSRGRALRGNGRGGGAGGNGGYYARWPCPRKGDARRIGRDEDIGRIGKRRRMDEDGESEVDPDEAETNRGWRTDSSGRPVTQGAGLVLTTLVSIYSIVNQASLVQLLDALKSSNPDLPPQQFDKGIDMKGVISRLAYFQTATQLNDLLYMISLIQLSLEIDQLKIEAVKAHKRKPGLPAISEKMGVERSTFQEWVTAGMRLVHLCAAGTLYMLPILAALGLRTFLTKKEHVDSLNSLADALREVSDSKWGPLVKRLMGAMRYIQTQMIGSLFTLPERSALWDQADPSLYTTPPTFDTFPEVVKIRTPLVLEKSTKVPFEKTEASAWTERERVFACKAEKIVDLAELEEKLNHIHSTGKSEPGKYVQLNPEVAQGKTLIIEDSTGQMLGTLISMPDDLVERLKAKVLDLETIMPGEYRSDDSRRPGYKFNSNHYQTYGRMIEDVNFKQRMPYVSSEAVEHTVQYEALISVFDEVLEFHRVHSQFAHLLPEHYEALTLYVDILPLSPNTPAYPFSGFVVNLRVCTDGHKDGFDKDLCTVIVISTIAKAESSVYLRQACACTSGSGIYSYFLLVM
ncbi:hypothetical protein B0H17DRAFT_1183717 [Mycena rosella]|uniref:Uncharacterized protein n=1 Tax=Mycena rosella TaxID=1033263 RepID=A0AAD7CZ38_MYCRO|nr:hypothetical protein B0H17DRAFT_1183717 [Mycena rosella]